MRHPTDGTLRRLLDEPAGVADADRQHVTGCPACLSGLVAAQRDAALTGAALDVGFDVDVDAGWSRLSQAIAADERAPHPAAAPAARRSLLNRRPSRAGRSASGAGRWRAGLRQPVVAVVTAVALVTGAGAAAAADWLQIFRAEQIAPVTLTQQDLVGLPDLAAYGTVEMTEEVDVRGVPDAAAARQATGLQVPRVGELPRGVSGQPAFQVGSRVSAQFTFSVQKAAQTAAATGKALPPPPPGLDGSQFRLSAGPGLAAVWTQPHGAPSLIVARAVAPTAYSAGVPFPTAAGYLLSLPGLPDAVASQLRGLTGSGSTLPLPVNDKYLTSSITEVDGAAATVLASRDGLLAAVVWVDDGIVTAVAGSLSSGELLTVARNLEDR